ncbi:siroheme decarboxylase subunit alpha [Nitratidesulfovibrio sp. SRB-5]|uniref:siroheme decarboxylase subunit alpha n=1 Tax=Nitratidesulfovibrio sp. SRB-5 TaxID=2872636 RepID=UPI00102631AD|nr:siroheme decarboxylase subunit alpha [Nitratidesulfovibrio sp. SRB-5]MBZ2171074.1 AsnC family transcriptional regulator [Nitratidesulfovibrio sp. SRB-5]RXF76167.1 Lrp/AsnC family transcriptional regulator [Desulfovibrio sp. DS-1]
MTASHAASCTETDTLDQIDKRILDVIQSDFPLESRPYAVIGEKCGVTEAEALARVRAMKERRLIRRMGANFQSAKLGFRSTLCAAKVPDEAMDGFVAEVNRHVGVTHNYLRNHEYNIWFTCIGPSWDSVCATLAEITAKTGIPILNLPATKLFKIKVDFQMAD